jgi:putative transposase
MGIARSTYYDTLSGTRDDTAIVEAIAAVCEEFECYGWRRVRAALRQQGLIVNHKKIKHLMREHGLQPKVRRRRVATTDSDHDQPIFPNLAKDMLVDGRDRLWVSDRCRLRLCRRRPRRLVAPMRSAARSTRG